MKAVHLQFVHIQQHPKPVKKVKMALIEQSKEPEFYADLIALLKKHSRPEDQDF